MYSKLISYDVIVFVLNYQLLIVNMSFADALKCNEKMFIPFSLCALYNTHSFSSPEPGELIVWYSRRRPCVRPSDHIFKDLLL